MNSFTEKIDSFVSEIKKAGADNCRIYETVKYDSGEEKLLKRRVFLNSGRVCVYRKGSSRRGYLYSPYANAVDVKLHVIERQPVDVKWRKSWEKVIKKLEKSGFWPELLKKHKLGLDIGLEKINRAYSVEYGDDRVEKIKAIDERLIYTCEDGSESFDTDIVWRMTSVAKVKKMYFGKYRNADILKQIEDAVDNERPVSVSAQASYDVSFSYKPEIKYAWYSEEYRGCGNGHYYLALDKTHALYYEDD